MVRRTSEIGIRMALGANRNFVVAMILRSAFLQTLFGLAIGVPVAFYGATLVRSQLYGLTSDEWQCAVGSRGYAAGWRIYAALAWCAIVENNEKTTGSPPARVHLAAMTPPSLQVFGWSFLTEPCSDQQQRRSAAIATEARRYALRLARVRTGP